MIVQVASTLMDGKALMMLSMGLLVLSSVVLTHLQIQPALAEPG
jgi:hypothetical protein